MRKAIVLIFMVLFALILVACKPDEDSSTKFDVNFIDGDTTLRTVQVEEGSLVTRPTDLESKSGFDFVDWYSTPSKSHRFDFTQPITANVNVYVGFSQYQEDTRDWYVLGSGTSLLLSQSNWGNNITADHELNKEAADKNEFSITLDLLAGDEFQFGGEGWTHKRGFGYLLTDRLEDGTIVFSGAGGGLGEVSAKGMNIKVELSGNYTVTLRTYPADDTYNTNDPSYTEENREVYNLGTYDYISWVRNGDPVDVVEVTTDFYIKGSNITQWQDIFNNATRFTKDGDIYTLAVYLTTDEEFLFTSQNIVDGVSSAGTKFVRFGNLDTTSQALFDESNNNMIAKASGLYVFTFNTETDVLSVTLDTDYSVPAADFYLTGVVGEDSWNQVTEDSVNPSYQFSQVGVTSNYELIITLAEGAQFQIEALKAGSTGRGTFGTEGWNQLGNYNFTFLRENEKFAAFDLTGQYPNWNIKALEAGSYKITFDYYSKLITITDSEASYDLYIKGAGINDWDHVFSSDYRFTETTPGVFVIDIYLPLNSEFGLDLYPEGTETGQFINKTALGTATGNVNSLFTGGTNTNLLTSVAGQYVIQYSMLTQKIDIFESETEAETLIDLYIKGESITLWKDILNTYTKMVNADGVYTLTIYLKADDQVMFHSTFTVGDNVSVGDLYLNKTTLDVASQALFDISIAGNNLKVLAAGMYTFTYDLEDDVLSVVVDTEVTAPEIYHAADFYLSGNFGEGNSWNQITADSVNAEYLFVQVGETSVYKISDVELEAGNEFIVEALKAGSTGRGTWGTENWAQLGTFNYLFAKEESTNYEPVSLSNRNIKVLTSGTYDIEFDAYARIITITKTDQTYDIYIKGSGINNWAHDWSTDYLFEQDDADANLYVFTITFVGDEEFGLELHPEGASTGFGEFLNKTLLGTAAGNANDLFVGAASNNFEASTAGTYMIVVDMSTPATPVVNIFPVE